MSPEERADLEERVSHLYAGSGREVVVWVTRHGQTFPTWSTVLSLPRLPGDDGPPVVRVTLPDASPDDDEDL